MRTRSASRGWRPGRHKILARYRSYHGGTGASLTATGDPRRWAMEPGMPGIIHVPHPYHGPKRGTLSGADALAELEEVIMLEGPQTIAGFLIETVTGTNGIHVPPDGYLEGVRALCDKHGILLICDEVMSGFGRTGEWFAVDHWKVVPDILVMAKGLTSAYVALGAVGIRRKIADHFKDKVFYGGLTYNSHPLGCAAALATIAVYEEDKLIERAKTMGVVMRRMLEELKAKHPCVGDVRSIGLFGIVELVEGSQDDGAAGAVQRHLAGDAGARQVLPRGRALHVRALERLLHESAAVHHRGGARGSVRDHRQGALRHRQGDRVKILLFGATGLAGGGVLRACLASPT